MQNEGKVIPINIGEQMKVAYIDYAMSVIVGRALPDVRDGFKPVHRRILYTMHELGVKATGGYKKSARIVGDVLGKYHPHGDTAIYEAMVRMAQTWNMREALVDGQGNYGSSDGDGPAAMRYTEARLTKIAEAVLEDLGKNTVDFQLNFDDTLQEPLVLPTRVPQLILNGSSGIAVGMATNMMPHNLGETIDACLAYIQNNAITPEELLQYLPAPDFPTGGIIYGTKTVEEAMRTGRGTVIVRGKVHVENTENDRARIIIDEVPYQVNRDVLTQKIADLVNAKKIEGISNVANQSNKDGTRILVELKKGIEPEIIINQLYKHTPLQSSFGVNNVALVKGKPKTLSMKELIAAFIEFRHEIVVRRTQHELAEAEKKAHILKGYLIALENLDEVVRLIRESANAEVARNGLIQQFSLSEVQAKAVLELRLQRLTGLEREKISASYEEELKVIARCRTILGSETERYAIISTELLELKARHASPRRSEIQPTVHDFNILDITPKEDVVITISHEGYIKRTPATAYTQQRRGGRGAKGAGTASGDWIEHLFIASTHHTLLFFTEKGRCHWLKVYTLPVTNKDSKGRSVQNLLTLEAGDYIRTVINIPSFEDKDFLASHSILLCTRKGIIKKTSLSDFANPRNKGIRAIQILAQDTLLTARLTGPNSEVLLAVKSGYAVRFRAADIRNTGRGSIGVKAMGVKEEDTLVGMVTADKNTDKTILVVSEKGYGKRTPLDEYRLVRRNTNSKGVKTIHITEKTGSLIAILDVSEGDDLMITCKSGITIRTPVHTIGKSGRSTQGVRLINIREGDAIAAIARADGNMGKSEEDEG